MKRLLLLSTCLIAATAAQAQQAGMQSPAYRECTSLASSTPTQALAKADAWLKIDTGIAAQHCRAMALYGLRRFSEAGDVLVAVRDLVAMDNITLRSYVTRQAVNALIGANRVDQALGVLGAQINDISSYRGDNALAASTTSELLLERARIQITYGKLDEAAKDLDHAVSLTPVNETVLMERASVFEKLGDISLAHADFNNVLTINANNSPARAGLARLGGELKRMPAETTAVVAPEPASASSKAPEAAAIEPVTTESKRKPYASHKKSTNRALRD